RQQNGAADMETSAGRRTSVSSVPNLRQAKPESFGPTPAHLADRDSGGRLHSALSTPKRTHPTCGSRAFLPAVRNDVGFEKSHDWRGTFKLSFITTPSRIKSSALPGYRIPKSFRLIANSESTETWSGVT